MTLVEVEFKQAHFELYQAYQQHRHSDSIAPSSTLEEEISQYKQFLCQTNIDSLMVEFRDAQHTLKMVSVIDIVADGLSAVYTFYDTTDDKASYGTFNIVWQIQWAQQLQLEYVYLGYWIAESRKMAYKEKFMPKQRLVDDAWQNQANHATDSIDDTL